MSGVFDTTAAIGPGHILSPSYLAGPEASQQNLSQDWQFQASKQYNQSMPKTAG